MTILKEVQTEVYTQDSVDKTITLSVVEWGGSEETSMQNAMTTFNQLGLDANEILKIETTEYPRHYTANELA
tara:strand:+ start:252 stop:467 length:216 start_codon:yes stop_codon:yes gene_type:complete